jgi:ribosomal protein L6P/L9E
MPLISQIVMYLEVEVTIPLGVCVVCFKKKIICCVGIKNQRVCQSVLTVHIYKLFEVYKGKCIIMYVAEIKMITKKINTVS